MSPRRVLLAGLLAAAALATAGCSGLFRSNAVPEQVYLLRAPGAASTGVVSAAGAPDGAGALPASASVRVAHPLAAPGLDGAHIMLVQPDHRMNFYAASRWAAPLPELVEALAVQTLRASGEWPAVEDSGSAFPSEYLLEITVRRFEADYATGSAAPEVEVVFDCTLGRSAGHRVLASFVARGSAPAGEDRLGAVVTAFQRASGAALGSLARQAAEAVRADREAAPEH
ncbi:MAG TPA: ABC-type transport auxiliary lipoprotein family protein [Steroidobacteraceae bacterium]|nr:ABC-type transport auxiliary lipoprotein family protein [Steroidobacteraceae bacterium]